MPTVKLTKRTIDALPPPASDTFFWDTSLAGFGLKQTKGGKKLFVVQYRVGGGRAAQARRYTIGAFGTFTVDQARSEAERILRDVATGQDPMAARKEKRDAASATVGEAITDFLQLHHRKLGHRHLPEIERTLNKDVVPLWATRRLDSITRRDVIDLLEGVAARGAPVQANRVLTQVRKFFNWCVETDRLPASPVVRVAKQGVETDRDRILDDDELADVWRAIAGMKPPFGPCIQILILTAQRRDEVAGMCWSEVDLGHAMWTIPKERAKNGKEHLVPLSPEAVAILDAQPRLTSHDDSVEPPRLVDVDLIFTTNGRTQVQGFSKVKIALDKAIVALRQKRAQDAGRGSDDTKPLPHWVLHDLRRTVTSGLARLGTPPHVADKILNHTEGTIRGVAAVYNRHLYIDERRVALDGWARHVMSLVDGSRDNVVPLKRMRKGAA